MQFRPRATVIAAVVAAVSPLGGAMKLAADSALSTPVAKPRIVVPGDWMTDKGGKYLFLPMTIPEGISLQQCKVLCNGDSLLVVVTEQPQDEPDIDALRKYKFILDALKAEAGHDEKKLKAKLSEWLDTEEDEEVRVRVKSAFDSLMDIREAKNNTSPRTLAVSLGLPKSFLQKGLQLRGSGASPKLSHGLPATAAMRTLVAQSGRGKHVRVQGGAAVTASAGAGAVASHAASIIRESFTIDIPYPVPIPRVFAVLAAPGKVVIGMPFKKNSLEAKGVSTGGKPFARVPVFGMDGKLLAGPQSSSLSQLASELDVLSLSAQGASGLAPAQV